MLTAQRLKGIQAFSRIPMHEQTGRAVSSEPEDSSPSHRPAVLPCSPLEFWTVAPVASSRRVLSAAGCPNSLPDAAGHFGK